MKLTDKILGKYPKNQPWDKPVPLNAAQVTLRIKGIHCGACASNIEHALKREEGVLKAKVDHSKGSGLVIYDPSKTSKEQIQDSTIFREPSMFSAELVEQDQVEGGKIKGEEPS